MNRETAEERKIFDAVVGSQAYGTNRPDSDIDTVGICIPTEDYFYSSKRFDQFVYPKKEFNIDRTIYDLKKSNWTDCRQ